MQLTIKFSLVSIYSTNANETGATIESIDWTDWLDSTDSENDVDDTFIYSTIIDKMKDDVTLNRLI